MKGGGQVNDKQIKTQPGNSSFKVKTKGHNAKRIHTFIKNSSDNTKYQNLKYPQKEHLKQIHYLFNIC